MSSTSQAPAREQYPSDLTDTQWELVEPFVRGNPVGPQPMVHYDVLRGKVRKKAGRAVHPSAGILDSQSVKTDVEAEKRGYDANKTVKGRKRHLLVDTLGLVLVAWLTPADVQGRDAIAAVG